MSKKTLGHIFALFTIIVWGTTFIASKTLLTTFSPAQTMLMRFVIAYIVLTVINHKYEKFNLKNEIRFILLALSGNTLYFICENVALTYTLASNVSILLALAPMLTAILAHFLTKDEKLHKGIFIGFAIAIVGVGFVVFNGTVLLKLNPLGDLLSFGAAIMWAIYSILLKYSVNHFEGTYLTRKVSFYSILTTIPIILFENKGFPLQSIAEPKILISLLFLGIIGSGICYIAWNFSTKTLGVIATNNYIYLIPFVTLISAGLLLEEPITLMGVLGAILIVGGIIISEKFPKISRVDMIEFLEEND